MALVLAGTRNGNPLLFIHKASFILWLIVAAIHILYYLVRVPRILGAEVRPPRRRSVANRGLRFAALAGALVVGVGLGPRVHPRRAHLGAQEPARPRRARGHRPGRARRIPGQSRCGARLSASISWSSVAVAGRHSAGIPTAVSAASTLASSPESAGTVAGQGCVHARRIEGLKRVVPALGTDLDDLTPGDGLTRGAALVVRVEVPLGTVTLLRLPARRHATAAAAGTTG